jgi:hypothetical protein
VSTSDLMPLCRDLIKLNMGKVEPANLVMFSVVAEASVAFTAGGGFTWPADRSIRISYGGGASAFHCYDTMDPNGSPASLSAFSLSPKSNTVKVMWVRTGEKTPNNPTGQIEGGPDSFSLTTNPGLSGKCTGPGIEQHPISGNCSTRYGS